MSRRPARRATGDARPAPTRRSVVRRFAVLLVLLALLAAGAVYAVVRSRNLGTGNLTSPSARCEATVGGKTADLTVAQSYYAAIIAGVAVQRGLAPRAVTVALATALQESGLRNLDYGDLDSVGLFQQRPSQGWGTVAQILNPQYSAGKFYDALVKIKNWQARDVGEVAQAVQRSAYPDAYDKHVDRAKLLASALSGETTAAFTCVTSVPTTADAAGYVALLSATYGSKAPATVTTGPPASVAVASTADATTWSVAAATQAWAATFGITGISVGGKSWQPSETQVPLWYATTPAAGTAALVVQLS